MPTDPVSDITAALADLSAAEREEVLQWMTDNPPLPRAGDRYHRDSQFVLVAPISTVSDALPVPVSDISYEYHAPDQGDLWLCQDTVDGELRIYAA